MKIEQTLPRLAGVIIWSAAPDKELRSGEYSLSKADGNIRITLV
jgi:hypothetical protein